MYYVLINKAFWGLTISKETLATYSIKELLEDIEYFTGEVLEKKDIKSLKFLYQS
jgi:hypothetical protein